MSHDRIRRATDDLADWLVQALMWTMLALMIGAAVAAAALALL